MRRHSETTVPLSEERRRIRPALIKDFSILQEWADVAGGPVGTAKRNLRPLFVTPQLGKDARHPVSLWVPIALIVEFGVAGLVRPTSGWRRVEEWLVGSA